MGAISSSWLGSKGYHNVVIEVDCQRVSNSVNKEHVDSSEFREIVKHCKTLLKSSPDYKVCFIRRKANLVAHSLARDSRSYASFHDFEIYPTCIAEQYLKEVII